MATAKRIKKEDLEAVLMEQGGNVTYTAEQLECSRRHVYSEMERNGIPKEYLDECREIIVDHAEHGIMTLAKERNPTACIFILKTKGRSRGYSETDTQTAQMLLQMTELWARTLSPS